MQTLLISALTIALAEIGDKTQLLALILAAKYRRPWPICLGILVAASANHAMAGALGALVAQWLTPELQRWLVALSFFSVALWALKPDRADADDAARASSRSVFVATLISFFLAEIGDKTQIATMLLATQYHPVWQVIVGTTAGMLIADVPIVWFGARCTQKLPLKAARIGTALLFTGLALWILLK